MANDIKPDMALWQHRSEWGGLEGTRLLFETLFGDVKTPGGLLGDVLVYRGVNLPRLFEGTYIAYTWARWFQELTLQDELARGQTTSLTLPGEGNDVRRRVAQCVSSRHPSVTINFQSPSPITQRWCDSLRNSRLSPLLSVMKAFPRFVQRGDPLAGKTADLAFFPWAPKIATTILPVAEAAVSQGRMTACLAGWELSPPFKTTGNFAWDTPMYARSPRILMEAWRASYELRDRWKALLLDGRLNSLGQWRGWDMRPLVIPFLNAAVSRFHVVIANIRMAEEWCKRRRLRGIVVPQDGGESVRSLIAGASLAGVRSFSVQYGYPMDTPEISEPMEDLAFLNGELAKRCFLQRGASPNKLAVVGTTAYDSVARLRSERASLRIQLANRYHLDSSRPWIVVATWKVQPVYSRSAKEAELALVMEAASRLPNAQVLFKLHPSDEECGAMEMAAAERFGVDSRIIDDIAENERLLCSADAVVCNYTTLAIMAIVAKTPVVVVDVIGVQNAPDRTYVDEGVADFANTAASAEAVFRGILEIGRDAYWEYRRDDWNRFISERLNSDDGQAAARILQTIEAKLDDDTRY